MDSVYKRCVSGGELKVGYTIHWKAAIVCLLKYRKGPVYLSGRYGSSVVDSTLTPSVALLVFVHPSGSVYSIVNCHGFTRSQM